MPANESSLITTFICLVAHVVFIFGMGHLSDKFRAQEDAHRLCVVHQRTVPAFMLLNTGQFFTVLGCRAGAVPGSNYQRRYALSSYSDRDVPDGGCHRLLPCRSTWRTPCSAVPPRFIFRSFGSPLPAPVSRLPGATVGVSCVALVAM